MSRMQQLIAREIRDKDPVIIATAIGDVRMEYADDGGGLGDASPVYVQDFEIGSNRPLYSVVVKGGADGSRAYARQGMSCELRWGALGRYVCVGPGNLISGAWEVRYYDFSGTQTGAENKGFAFIRHAFQDYKNGANPTTFWADGVRNFPWVDIIDGDGNPVG